MPTGAAADYGVHAATMPAFVPATHRQTITVRQPVAVKEGRFDGEAERRTRQKNETWSVSSKIEHRHTLSAVAEQVSSV